MSNHTYGPSSGVILPPNPHLTPAGPSVRRGQRHHFLAELSQCLFDFVVQLLPTPEELAIKEDVRKLLERLIRNVEPDSRLLSFGSTANGFALRNSDMDLCCLIDSDRLPPTASEMVVMVADLLERETKFQVKPLPKARIPIIKLTLAPTQGLPYGIACDIGFENRLALENTRLLLSYATLDPTRVRTMVLFLKLWSKRRKINSPYLGTLSSYGYALMVIFFLVHVKHPPVLPNLQVIPPLRPITKEDMHIGEHNIWFFDDTELLKQTWQSANTDGVGELLVDFFKYFSHDFPYNTHVISIRGGLLEKTYKGWYEPDPRAHDLSRDRNRLCIEDPFEISYNVGRTVTKDGLYTIRGEFMRASRIFASRPDRAFLALTQLCEERDEELVRAPSPQPYHGPPRSFPAQSPYIVGTHFWRPVTQDRLSPPRPSNKSIEAEQQEVQNEANVPDHMAPRRQRWTSPPPPDAPAFEQNMYRKHLGIGISIGTTSMSPVSASENDMPTNDDILEEEEPQSDLASSPTPGDAFHEPNSRWKRQSASFGSTAALETSVDVTLRTTRSTRTSPMVGPSPEPSAYSHTAKQNYRGRPAGRGGNEVVSSNPPSSYIRQAECGFTNNTDPDSIRRSFSGPPAVRTPIVPLNGAPSGPAPTNATFTRVSIPTEQNNGKDEEPSPTSLSSETTSTLSRRLSGQPLAQWRPQAFPLYQNQSPTSSPGHENVSSHASDLGRGIEKLNINTEKEGKENHTPPETLNGSGEAM
ncbi:hypothetical protein DACRYDRAFT_81189 [Dacryopinax primogenitus]|uniref:polynucleotide adenylyltransferase n=1 Tax=Dacryopinax primogenitus (strain DJM 731) TaxID=1858805 RepID=M5FSA2_DACPD|nr:uncharacterized protein DACRYDRAFT_81189 [Dacryopinax primogenitus]EJU00261.1 hypothetical protein DACRYDRAFT_81189 [Dacryopinax primogenitus]